MTALAAPTRPEPRTSSARSRLVVAACLIVVAALAVWFRYRAVGISSLWLDDAWVGVGAHFPTIGDTIGSGLTSPGFSLLYRGWANAFGSGATTAQLLALGFAVGAPVVLFIAATERGVRWFAGLLGAGLLATAPAHVDMSVRLKQYTAEALAATVVLWLAWRLLDRPGSSGRWAALTAAAVGAGLLSGIGALVAGEALVVCIAAAWLSKPRQLRAAAIGTGVFALVMVPWALLVVRPNVHPKLAAYWRGYFLDGSGLAGGLIPRMRAVAHGFQSLDTTFVLLCLAAAAVIVLVRRPFVGVLLALPLASAVVLAALRIAPIGTGRTDVYLFPSLALLIAVAVSEIASMLAPRGRWATAVVGGLAIGALVVVALVAAPAVAYPPEDLGPLVHIAEAARRPGDKIVVYPTAGFAYGIATRLPIQKRADVLSPTDWVVKVRDPNIVVLEAHRDDPEKWSGPLDQITAGSPRIWLIGSHLFLDWPVLQQMLVARGYEPVRTFTRPGAELKLFVRPPTASVTPSP